MHDCAGSATEKAPGGEGPAWALVEHANGSSTTQENEQSRRDGGFES